MTITTNNLTMSSGEIAELTGKRKIHIHRDIKEQLLEGLYGKIDDPNLDHEQIQGLTIIEDERGRWKEVHLDRYHTDILVSGYAIYYRAAVIKRWHELNAMDDQERLKGALATSTIEDTESWSISEWANMLKDRYGFLIGERKLHAWLLEEGYAFLCPVRHNLKAYGKYEHGERGYFKMVFVDVKDTDERYVLKITGKGLKALTPLVMRLTKGN